MASLRYILFVNVCYDGWTVQLFMWCILLFCKSQTFVRVSMPWMCELYDHDDSLSLSLVLIILINFKNWWWQLCKFIRLEWIMYFCNLLMVCDWLGYRYMLASLYRECRDLLIGAARHVAYLLLWPELLIYLLFFPLYFLE